MNLPKRQDDNKTSKNFAGRALSHLVFVAVVCLALTGCSNDDDNGTPPEPSGSGFYFAKTIILYDGSDPGFTSTFTYNDANRISRIDVVAGSTEVTYTFDYNEDGWVTDIYGNEVPYLSFDYTDGILSAVSEFDEDGNSSGTHSMNHNNGTYTIPAEGLEFSVDDQNQITSDLNGANYAYGESAGIHRYLKLQPAFYFMESTIIAFLGHCKNEWTSYSNGTETFAVENTRDTNDNITDVQLTTGAAFNWKITYEEREVELD